MRVVFVFIYLILMPFMAHAESGDMKTLRALMEATRTQGYAQAKTHVTERSVPLFDRLWGYGVPLYFPEDFVLKKEETVGDYRYAWVHPAENSTTGTLILAFTDEDGSAKLDLPETFQNGLGPNWPQRLDMLEKAYLIARQQMGDEAALKMIQGMMRGPRQPQ